MFESQDFREKLLGAVKSEAAQNNMNEYQTAIIDFLRTQAVANESTLMESERTKNVAQRRGVPEALTSARQLIKTASAIAAKDKRTLLTEADVRAAHTAMYCRVWPFCK
jgi:hypothetical protein